MFKKRTKVLSVLFSFTLMAVLIVIAMSREIEICQDKRGRIESIIQNVSFPSKIYLSWPEICFLRKNAFLSDRSLISRLINKMKLKNPKITDVYRWAKDSSLTYLDPYDVFATPDLQSRISRREFIPADNKESLSFYEKKMLGLARLFPALSLWYYFIRLFLVLSVSAIPYLLGLLSQFLVLSPITIPFIPAFLLLIFLVNNQGRADNMVIKLNTSTTGGSHTLSLGMLDMWDRTGALILLNQKGIQGAYGPLWKFKKGMIFSPVGVVCGQGENGARIEYISLWHISKLQLGKLNHVVMGSYNFPVLKDRAPYAGFKETLYYAISKFEAGIRIDYLFQKIENWKTKIGIGPTLKLIRKNFSLHLHASVTKPYTIKTEWELAF